MKAVFEASDGTTHATAALAKKREELTEAVAELRTVVKRIGRLNAESLLTADGVPFELGRSRDYYFVADTLIGLPRLLTVWLYPYSIDVDMDRDGVLTLREYKHGDRNDGRWTHYRIDELYSEKAAAEAAVLARAEQRLAEMQADMETMRKERRAR